MKASPRHYVCIHGHFYQPPRENPWTGRVNREPSAAPFHDWNERITAECYAPNAHARVLGRDGEVAAHINNYARMSYNFGPTLLDWLERNAAPTYEAVIASDRESASRFSGHGSAIAQAYSHPILPLSTEADKDLQVEWGLRDFEDRFGRRATGFWLPETAVDVPTLEALARHGVAFTILAPHQARRVRRTGDTAWHDTPGGTIDTTRAYRCRLPSGRSIALFFYDGPTSRAIAFEKLLTSGETFARRLVAVFDGGGDHRDRLSSVATDGETYGHHHKFGDMGLAFATELISSSSAVALTNYSEFLARHPPRYEVEIAEATSWSCVHGVERWRSDCGCSSGSRAGWHQRWRGPLREALDHVREGVAAAWDALAPAVFRDPAAALRESVILARPNGGARWSSFLIRHQASPLGPIEQTRAAALLEMRRQAVLLQASCGFFFADIAGLEPVQVLAHARRAIELCRELGGGDLEPECLAIVARAPGNRPQFPNGRVVYEKRVISQTRR